MVVKSVLLAVCWQMSCYILAGYNPFFHRRGECCIIRFPKYTHYVCWWRLAISAGGLTSACQFQSNPRKLTRGKLLMKHMYTILLT